MEQDGARGMDEDILVILMSGLVVLVPVAGLTLRFALKPMVDSIARLLEARNGSAARSLEAIDLVDKRLALFEQELQLLRGEVQQLDERSEFYEKLTGPR
jgi:hypothetical protein